MAGIREKTAKRIHRSAAATARKRGYGKQRTKAYVYGAKRRAGWKPGPKRKKGGK
jgi:hypothetical protein